MKLFARFYRLVWGADVDRALRPVLAVQFAGSLAGSVAWIFMGIWAKVHLGASDRQLAVTFLVGAGVTQRRSDVDRQRTGGRDIGRQDRARGSRCNGLDRWPGALDG